MGGRGYPVHSASSYPCYHHAANLSPTTGPLSSDLSSTLQSSKYGELPNFTNILNVVPPASYMPSNNYVHMGQMFSQPMLHQGAHVGGLRVCKVEYNPVAVMVPGEDEAHSGQTNSPGMLDINPNHQGWFAGVDDNLQFSPGPQFPGHPSISADQLNQVYAAAESSCVTDENQNQNPIFKMNGPMASRYLGESTTSGRNVAWAR